MPSATIPWVETGLERRTPLAGGLHDPVAVRRKRRNAGQTATARAAVWSRRPADDADSDSVAQPILNYRTAGIPGACPKPVASALSNRIDEANLQASWPAGGDEAGDANGPSAAALSADRDADAGDGELAADDDRDLRHAEHRCIFSLGRGFELQQRHVGGGAMRRHRLHIERRVNGHAFHVLQLRLPVGSVFDDLVGCARL